MISVLGLFPTAQSTAQNTSYKRNALEIKLGAGGTMFFGDLGGSKGKRKDGFFDLDIQSMRANTSFGIKFNFNNRIALRTDACYAQVSGSDGFSGDPGRFRRNLSFRSNIYEFSITTEVVLVNLSQFGRKKTGTSELYAFIGGGVFQFNPQAQLDGVWHDLQPLGTEGQGLKPGSDLYSLTSFVLPFGGGYRKNIGEKSYIGVELSMRKSFTDYIDDVSGSYFDTGEIRETRGVVAAELADRTLDNSAQANEGRGNPRNNDNYSFVQITFARSIGRTDAGGSKMAQRFRRPKVKCPEF